MAGLIKIEKKLLKNLKNNKMKIINCYLKTIKFEMYFSL